MRPGCGQSSPAARPRSSPAGCSGTSASARRRSILAIVAIRHAAAFGRYIADCPLPDPRQLLTRAVDYQAGQHPGLAGQLRATAARVTPGRGAPRLPSEIWLLAGLLTAYAQGKISFGEVTGQSGNLLSACVSEWFEPLAYLQPGPEADEQVRLAAFRIALAVLNSTPAERIAEAGQELADELLTAAFPARRARNRPVFASHRDEYLANSHARRTPGKIVFTDATVPATFAAYNDDRMPAAVLRQAWDAHAIRRPLISWLQSLSQDPRPFVWMSAALTIGQLSSWDFAYAYHELINPWASSPGHSDEDQRRRHVAAVALDAAARSEEVRPVIRETLDEWCRGTPEERQAAATALGYDLGLQDPGESLKLLRRIGCSPGGDLALIASWALMRIFTRGGLDPAPAALQAWLADDRRQTRQLGQLTVLLIANMTVADVTRSDPGNEQPGRHPAPGREQWPFLVAVADKEPGLLGSLADLVWAVTQASAARKQADQALTRWIRAGEKDEACIGPVARFLALLGDTDANRGRLLHLVSVQRNDPDDPLPARVASRITSVIQTSAEPEEDRG